MGEVSSAKVQEAYSVRTTHQPRRDVRVLLRLGAEQILLSDFSHWDVERYCQILLRH